MVDAKLILNGQDFPLHHKMLSVIASHLPDSENYAPLARALLALDLPSITSALLESSALSLSADEWDALWEKADIHLKRQLADEYEFLDKLTDAQARQIIDLNDPEILKNIADNAENLYPGDDEEQPLRLSVKMADTLLEFIANHADARVRRALEENSLAPVKFRPALREKISKGIWTISNDDVANMSLDDLDALRAASPEVLKKVVYWVEGIKNASVRAKAIELLCSYPDPAIRLELAENHCAPQAVFQRLAEDQDLDVALVARESLKDK